MNGNVSLISVSFSIFLLFFFFLLFMGVESGERRGEEFGLEKFTELPFSFIDENALTGQILRDLVYFFHFLGRINCGNNL